MAFKDNTIHVYNNNFVPWFIHGDNMKYFGQIKGVMCILQKGMKLMSNEQAPMMQNKNHYINSDK